jgi:hypothetical protein
VSASSATVGINILDLRWLRSARAEADHEIAVLERHGGPDAARSCRAMLDLVERALRRYAEQLLTLEQAAQESGYTISALEKMARTGRLRFVRGEARQRFVRRCDLAFRAGRAFGTTPGVPLGHLGEPARTRPRIRRPRVSSGEPDLAEQVLRGRADPAS